MSSRSFTLVRYEPENDFSAPPGSLIHLDLGIVKTGPRPSACCPCKANNSSLGGRRMSDSRTTSSDDWLLILPREQRRTLLRQILGAVSPSRLFATRARVRCCCCCCRCSVVHVPYPRLGNICVALMSRPRLDPQSAVRAPCLKERQPQPSWPWCVYMAHFRPH